MVLASLLALPGAWASALPVAGDGSEDSPYLIGSVADWNGIAVYIAENSLTLSGTYTKLTADIDFGGDSITPIGYDRSSVFDGDFDGSGYTVKGFKNTAAATHYGPLFIQTGRNAHIHDLRVEGELTTEYQYSGGVAGDLYGKMSDVVACVTVSSSASYTGGIAGYVGSDTELSGCVNEGQVTSSWLYTGGIAGYSFTDVVCVGCCNRGTVTSSSAMSVTYTAGLFGLAHNCTLTGCWNEGTVTTSGDGGGCAGLIAMASTTGSSTFTLTGCYNTGEITSLYYNAGLILNGSYLAMFVMTDCYNAGDVTSTYTSSKSSTYTAGVSACFFQRSTYRNCWNSGNVTTYGTSYTGGVFGYCKYNGSTEEYRSCFEGCYNTGAVTAAGSYTGGVFAYMHNYLTADSCYNTGSVTGASYTGGIAGYVTGASTVISRSWNAGDITTSSSRAGGILGSTSSNCELTSCFNAGNVASTSPTKGTTTSSGYAIGGIAGLSAATMTDVYSVGVITGASCVGGIVGYSSKGYTTLNRAYFAGRIAADADTCGNIMGMSMLSNGKIWASGNSIGETYFLSANDAVEPGIVKDTVSAGLTYAQMAVLDLGENWAAGDDCTYPRLAALADNEFALAYAAAVIPDGDDTYESITKDFYVGRPDGVVWSASSDAVEIDGNQVRFTESFTGALTMTATAGDVEVATQLTCDVTVDGIGNTALNSRTLVGERLYNAAGVAVDADTRSEKAIYIVVRTYSDGSSEVTKGIR